MKPLTHPAHRLARFRCPGTAALQIVALVALGCLPSAAAFAANVLALDDRERACLWLGFVRLGTTVTGKFDSGAIQSVPGNKQAADAPTKRISSR